MLTLHQVPGSSTMMDQFAKILFHPMAVSGIWLLALGETIRASLNSFAVSCPEAQQVKEQLPPAQEKSKSNPIETRKTTKHEYTIRNTSISFCESSEGFIGALCDNVWSSLDTIWRAFSRQLCPQNKLCLCFKCIERTILWTESLWPYGQQNSNVGPWEMVHPAFWRDPQTFPEKAATGWLLRGACRTWVSAGSIIEVRSNSKRTTLGTVTSTHKKRRDWTGFDDSRSFQGERHPKNQSVSQNANGFSV